MKIDITRTRLEMIIRGLEEWKKVLEDNNMLITLQSVNDLLEDLKDYRNE